MNKSIEQILKTMLPRYVSILDKHIKTIKQWRHPIMHAIHYLLISLNFAKGCFTLYLTNQSLRSLIDHLLSLLNEPILINEMKRSSTNIESSIIHAILRIFNELVYEPDALDYIQQCKPATIFRQLSSIPCETIIWSGYIMLAYTTDEEDIKGSPDDSSQLLYTTVNLLHTITQSRDQINPNDNISGNIIQLTKTLKGNIRDLCHSG